MQRGEITYVETKAFANQFCHHHVKQRSIKNQSSFCLVSTEEFQLNQLKEYLDERQAIIDRFNQLVNKPLKANVNLSLDSFHLFRSLGTGGFGSVFLAYHPDTHEYLALKAMKKSSLIESNDQNISISERQYAFALHHPNIVKFLTSFQDNEYVYLAFEWLQGGDLYSLLTCQKLTELQVQFYAGQIVMTLDYLHGCKIVFRDLKPENLVFTQRGYMKLIDLGLAKIIRGYTQTFCGTPHYIAPEVIMHRPYTFSPDYWSLGIVIHEMMTGDAPYDRTYRIDSQSDEIETDESIWIRQSSIHYNMYLRIIHGCSSISTKNLTDDCAMLIRDLLRFNIEERLGCGVRGALDLLEHRWFHSLNFLMLYQQKYAAPFLPIGECFLANEEHANETLLKFTASKQHDREFDDF